MTNASSSAAHPSLEIQEIDSSESSPGAGRPLRLLALGVLICISLTDSLTGKHQTDGGGIRGLSELLIIRAIMGKVMGEENEIRRKAGREPLSSPPRPCEYFDLIGGTSTGGCVRVVLYINYCHITTG